MNRTLTLSLGGISALLILGALLPKPAPKAPPPAKPAPVAAASAPMPAPAPQAPAAPATPVFPPSEALQYQQEIDERSQIIVVDTNSADVLSRMGAEAEASRFARRVRFNQETVACLANQLARRVPFYEGRARCATVAGSQS